MSEIQKVPLFDNKEQNHPILDELQEAVKGVLQSGDEVLVPSFTFFPAHRVFKGWARHQYLSIAIAVTIFVAMIWSETYLPTLRQRVFV